MTYLVQIDNVVRNATPDEIARFEAQQQDAAAQIAALETVAAAKASVRPKLAALGLTDAEIAAFLGV